MKHINIKSNQKFNYPFTRRNTSVKDNYHGVEIDDPYRWLEDDHSVETKEWVAMQNNFTFSYLNKITSRAYFQKRLTDLWDYVKYSSPIKVLNKYYFFKNDGLQNQAILYSSDELGGVENLILDPNKFSEDGSSSLGDISFSKDGNLLAYSVSTGGSDWKSIFVLDLLEGILLQDQINWVKFSSISWFKDGFFYSRYPEPKDKSIHSVKNEFHKIYYHKIGTAQIEDTLILEDKNHSLRNFYCNTTEEEDFLIISPVESTSGNSLYIKNLAINGPIFKLVDSFKYDYSVVACIEEKLYVLTNENAPNQKLISIDIKDLENPVFQTIIEEKEHYLRSCDIVGNKMFITYTVNVKSQLLVYDLKGKYLKEITLPGIGTISGISGKNRDLEGFFSFTSFVQPATIYCINTEMLSYKLYKKSNIFFDPLEYETKQEWFSSKDGTMIPMFITYKRGIVLNGQNPTLLYGYGGFNISVLPAFTLTKIPLLENGGIYVVANIRGGGEFGKKWHEAGILENKQNVFNDFIAAAEYLIHKKYTSSEKLAIEGGSNGGLLVGACMTQRPELFKVAFPSVGVLDMLRYHQFTIGWAWATDYGKSDDPEAFIYLNKYSPLHNIEEKEYPATLVTTADHDDRVVPAHSFKFISTLQSKHIGMNPVMIRIETSAGHGAGKPTMKIIEEAADKLSFMFENMGIHLI